MALLPIRIYPDPVLSEVAEPVEVIDDEIRKLVGDMAETMYAAPGVGLAANQVGVAKQIAVVDPADPEIHKGLIVLINPEILHEGGSILWEEGCLSIPGITEDVDRFDEFTVRALNLEGEEVTYEAKDFLAVVFQHEIDHLNGVLFWDHLSSLKRKLLKRKLKKLLAEEDGADSASA